MWNVRCKVSVTVYVSVCVLSLHTQCMYIQCACMRVVVCMCQTTVYFWVWVLGGERERAGAWQAEGQTWCSAEWVSAAGLLLLLRPGYYSGTLTGVVSPTWCACFAFIYQVAEGNWRRAAMEKHYVTKLSCYGTHMAKYFAHFTRWQCCSLLQ